MKKTKPRIYFVFFIVFFTHVLLSGIWGLTESSEGRYAEIAREMYLNNDQVNPTLLGIKHFHKPPITYYITELGYSLFGIDEFGARFFMQLALLIQMILVFHIGKIILNNQRKSFYAALIYAALPLVIISTKSLTTDAYLNTFILAALWSWLSFNRSKNYIFLYGFYIALGLIFETKGPVGWILPLVFILSFKIINKQAIDRSIHQFLGLTLMLFISALWYLFVIDRNPSLWDYFINHQLVDRVSNPNAFSRSKPFWYYLALLPALVFPWIFIALNKTKALTAKIQNSAYLKSLSIAALVFLLILSLSSSKLPLYILPSMAIIALIAVNLLEELKSKYVLLYPILFGMVLTIGFLGIHFIELNGLEKSSLFPGIAALVSLIISIVIFRNKFLSLPSKLVYSSAVIFGSLAISGALFLKEQETLANSRKPIAEFIQTLDEDKKEDHQVVVFNDLIPSLSFYLNRPIFTVNNSKYTTQREIQFEDDQSYKAYLIEYSSEKERLSLLLNQNNSILIINKKNKLLETLRPVGSQSKLFGKYEVIYTP